MIIAATEDSQEHTIVPRLMAAGADLNRVHFVDVLTDDGLESNLTLPVDLQEMRRGIKLVNAALVISRERENTPSLCQSEQSVQSEQSERTPQPLNRLACYCDALPEGGPCTYCDGPEREAAYAH